MYFLFDLTCLWCSAPHTYVNVEVSSKTTAGGAGVNAVEEIDNKMRYSSFLFFLGALFVWVSDAQGITTTGLKKLELVQRLPK